MKPPNWCLNPKPQTPDPKPFRDRDLRLRLCLGALGLGRGEGWGEGGRGGPCPTWVFTAFLPRFDVSGARHAVASVKKGEKKNVPNPHLGVV